MKAKELKRLGRSDLLEMLLELSLENDRMSQELTVLRAKMQQRAIDLEDSGSLAEAALKLNDVFRAAQAACEQYRENIRSRSDNADAIFREKEEQAQAQCRHLVEETEKQCREMLEQARKQSEQILLEARNQAREVPQEPKQEKNCKHTHKRKSKKQKAR